MVIQRAHWVQQQAMKEIGTLIRIDLDFKNVFNSAGHSCLWAILGPHTTRYENGIRVGPLPTAF